MKYAQTIVLLLSLIPDVSATVQALESSHTVDAEIPDIVVSSLRAALQGITAHVQHPQGSGP